MLISSDVVRRGKGVLFLVHIYKVLQVRKHRWNSLWGCMEQIPNPLNQFCVWMNPFYAKEIGGINYGACCYIHEITWIQFHGVTKCKWNQLCSFINNKIDYVYSLE